jgi:hypothetical protein
MLPAHACRCTRNHTIASGVAEETRVRRRLTSFEGCWYEGKPLPITRPQNQAGAVGHSLDRGTAPIYATTKEEWLAAIHNAIAYAKKQGKPSEHTMLLRRLRIYTLTVACPVAGNGVTFAMQIRCRLPSRQDGFYFSYKADVIFQAGPPSICFSLGRCHTQVWYTNRIDQQSETA